VGPMGSEQADVVLEAVNIAGVPVLLGRPTNDGGPWPTVLWYHGFRADALAHAGDLERLASAGFLAVGIDAVGHGARLDHTISDRISTTEGGAMSVMLPLVDQSIDEIPALISALVASQDADPSSVSLVGISMGAFLAYRAIAQGLRFRTVVALLGSPEQPGADSPHHGIDAFEDIGLLSVVAEHDVSVPPEPARAFHAALAARFGSSQLHRHHVLRGAGHLTNAAQWHEAMRVSLDWLHTKAR